VISVEDYLWYIDDSLTGMTDILTALGDDLANTTPGLPQTNSPYAIVTHCLGVMEFWGGQVVAGRDVQRDRAAEFTATGQVADLVARVAESRARLARDAERLDPAAPPRGVVRGKDADRPHGQRQGAVLMHVFEEVARHRGQLELTRDVLVARKNSSG
jgi:uncharacterized damage-inducible protein DinB